MNTLYIGIYMDTKKYQELFTLNLINKIQDRAQKDNCRIIFININTNNYNKYKFHKIVTKLDELYTSNTVNHDIVNFLTLSDSIVDPVKSQFDVGNRLVMAEKLQEISTHVRNIFVPEYSYYESGYCTFNYPVICKPLLCFGTDYAHDMCIINKNTDIKDYIFRPSLLQHYYDHNETIFKVYVIGKKFEVVIKNSVSFNDQVLYFNTSILKQKNVNISKEEKISMINKILFDIDIQYLNMLISLSFGLTLFGYDLIKIGDRYGIIDVNYLPGYKSMENYENYMVDYLY